ncbi:ankyrin repeat domain-containing protein 39-like [Rhopilema esculentum]|uniref:ankyrin repeat domain-containing protein 39-like n=1 Tax=Rhopilema esculentum TaxID=499914 RepID=UPI0031D172E3|eukprot:gene15145-6333_t
MCDHGASCHFHDSVSSSVAQSLDELEFQRGIWQAALDNDYARVNALIRKGVSPNTPDTYGYTALHYACRSGHEQIAMLLLENGADPNAKTASGKECPIHRAAYQGHEAIVRLLLKKGADPTIQSSDGQTALHKAGQRDKQAVIKILLEAAPDLDSIRDNKGNTALTSSEER